MPDRDRFAASDAWATVRFVLLFIFLVTQFWLLSGFIRSQTNHQGEVTCLAYRDDPVVHAKCVQYGWAK